MVPGACVPLMGLGLAIWISALVRPEADPVRLAWPHAVPWASQQLECRCCNAAVMLLPGGLDAVVSALVFY